MEQVLMYAKLKEESILKSDNIKAFTGHPIDITISAIDYIANMK